jgi:hypothetical protein
MAGSPGFRPLIFKGYFVFIHRVMFFFGILKTLLAKSNPNSEA